MKQSRELIGKWLNSRKQTTVQWVSWHAENLKNEVTDIEAKPYAKILLIADIQRTQTLASYWRKIRSLKYNGWKKEWEAENNTKALKKTHRIKPTTKARSISNLNLLWESSQLAHCSKAISRTFCKLLWKIWSRQTSFALWVWLAMLATSPPFLSGHRIA